MNDWMNRWEDFQKSAEPCLRYMTAEDLMHITHISLKNKFLYTETPKVACSTIKRLLIDAEYEGQVAMAEGESMHFREFSPLLNARQVGDFGAFLVRADIFKFCFVRNPYTRLLSAYLDKILSSKPQSRPVMIQLGYGLFSDKVLSFEEFVDAVVEQPVRYMDWHWRTQYYTTVQYGIEYDLVGRFENFEEDFRKAIGQTPIDFARYYQVVNPHATRANDLLEKYYTPALREKVYQKYQVDFEYFGYEK